MIYWEIEKYIYVYVIVVGLWERKVKGVMRVEKRLFKLDWNNWEYFLEEVMFEFYFV